nr:site-2 protease family protein [Azomonas macrocytogenes]
MREDLRLHEAAPDRDGAPVWSIQDPVTNRFYRIGWLEFECLLRWPGDPRRIAEDISANTALYVLPEQVEAFATFLARHNLLRAEGERLRQLVAQASQPGWRHWRWWLHHYLFVRVPLVRPERWLAALLPWMRPLFSPLGLGLLLAIVVLGLALVARQWDVFKAGVVDILTPAGILGFLAALAVSKTLHELGHALVATHLGVRVAHMGVAFVVLWPMLYTDTSESWRLRSSRQRLAISVAGLATELTLAGVAAFAWALLDDGPARQAMLYLATTGWVLSLALNISPFMRFDGYFILSDLLDFPNLHERSGAMARAWLRRTLLGWREPDPEPVTPRVRRALVGFAFATWLYRLLVFLAIAVAVYLFFFKVLGIVLFAVEVLWFLLWPIWSEVSVWQRRWSETRPARRRGLYLCGLVALLLLALPWRSAIDAPAMAHSDRQQFVFAPFAARVMEISAPGQIHASQSLAQFEAPDLRAQSLRSEVAAQSLDRQLGGLIAEQDGHERSQATAERLREQIASVRAVAAETARLQVTAEFAGTWLDIDPLLRAGSWVGPQTPIGVVIDPSHWMVEAYVEQRDVHRVAPGATASFRPDGAWIGLSARVVEVDSVRAGRLPHAMLDTRHGGSIPTHETNRDSAVATPALYRVRLELQAPPDNLRQVRGRVVIDGERQSLLLKAFTQVAAVLVRESGF